MGGARKREKMLYGRRLVLDRREGAEAHFLCPSGGGPSLFRSSGSGGFVLARSGAGLGLARVLGLGLRFLARALGLGPPAHALGLGLEPSARALGLGLGSWSLLPAWAWEPLLVGPTPHSCSTSPRRTGSFRATVFCRTLNKVELVMEPWTEDLKLSVARTSACSLK